MGHCLFLPLQETIDRKTGADVLPGIRITKDETFLYA